jgi:hypothetical protein
MDFVVGHPRSGTAFLSYVLAEAGGAASRHEYLIDATEGEIITAATEYYLGERSGESIQRLIRAYDSFPPIQIDGCWKLSWVMPALLELYPQARILHLVRNPTDNVRTCHNLDYYGTLYSDTKWRRSMPRVRTYPDWDSLSQFEKNCAFWTETHRLIRQALSPSSDRYLLVRFEELTQLAVVERALAFMGVAAPSRMRTEKVLATHVDTLYAVKKHLREAHKDALPAYPNWPQAHLQALRRHCGTMAEELGYRL